MNRRSKRPWQGDADADESLLGTRPRLYSPVERLILQQAASILQISNPFQDGGRSLTSRLGSVSDIGKPQHHESMSRSDSSGAGPSLPRCSTQTQGWDFEPILGTPTPVTEQDRVSSIRQDTAMSTGELQGLFHYQIPEAFIEDLASSSQPVPRGFPQMGLLPSVANEPRYGQPLKGTPHSSGNAGTPSAFITLQPDNITFSNEIQDPALLSEVSLEDETASLIQPYSDGSSLEIDQLLASDPVFHPSHTALPSTKLEILGNGNLPGSAEFSADIDEFNTLEFLFQSSDQLGDFDSTYTESLVDTNQFIGDIWPRAITTTHVPPHPKELTIRKAASGPTQLSSTGDIGQRRPSYELLNKLSAETQHSSRDISSSNPNRVVSIDKSSQDTDPDSLEVVKRSKTTSISPEAEGDNPFDESSANSDGPKIVVFYAGTTDNTKNIPKVRQPFKSMAKRKETAETRKTGACVRCRLQRVRCSPVQENEDGPCARCARISGPTLCKLPCFRSNITESELFDKGAHPQYRWSKRWSSWEMTEITAWASEEIRTIRVTQDVFGGSTIDIRCRKFIPVDGDSLSRTWKKNGELIKYYRGPYAIYNMKETGKAFKKFVAQNIGTSIRHYIMTKKDKLLSSTYSMAYKMVFQPKDLPDDPEGRRMLQDLFQLWVAIRMESQSERIIGDETLGMDPQTLDEDVGSYGTVSITPMMSAQVELITTTQILLPLKAAVLKRLQQLIKANDPRSWFSIYLSLFILLHSCSILTADENKQAKKYGLQTRYVYDKFVEALHNGAKTMLYYFHYCNKGSSPFTPGWITPENLRMVQLNHSQERFIRESTEMIHQRLPEFRRIREAKDFENDWYFVSQLYDTRWGPTTTI